MNKLILQKYYINLPFLKVYTFLLVGAKGITIKITNYFKIELIYNKNNFDFTINLCKWENE